MPAREKGQNVSQQEGVRINKFLSEAGICSRREADRQIAAGLVTIDGRTAAAGDKVSQGQEVLFDGRPVTKEEEEIILVLNKPKGIVCTAEKREKNNVIDFLQYPKRVYPVGRLDKDSEGLLLLTNNGDIVNRMMRAGNYHEKEYIVTVNRPVSDAFLRGLAGGVPLVELGVTTRRCRVERIGKKQFRIVLTQGLNRQIRRMCEYFGYRVENLVRVRIMNIELGDLAAGEHRRLTDGEYRELKKLLADSCNEPAACRGKRDAEDKKKSMDDRNRRSRHDGKSYDGKSNDRKSYNRKSYGRDASGRGGGGQGAH